MSIEQISTRYRFCTKIIKLASLPGFLSNRGHGDFSVHKLEKRDKQLHMRKLHSQVKFMSTQNKKKIKNLGLIQHVQKANFVLIPNIKSHI